MATAVADGHAAAVEFPNLLIPQDAPVGIIAQWMVDGRFDKAFLVSEIERFTGVKLDIAEKPGKLLPVAAAGPARVCHPTARILELRTDVDDQVFRAAGYEVDYVTPRGQRPFVYGVSLDTSFRDQAWSAAQGSSGETALGTRYNDRMTTEGQRLNEPRNLNAWLPPTPGPHSSSLASSTHPQQFVGGQAKSKRTLSRRH